MSTSRPKRASGLAATARALLKSAPKPEPEPLNVSDFYDLVSLRGRNLLPKEATFASEQEELAALRAAAERELAELRALTPDLPSYPMRPAAELEWRRPYAEQARKAKLEAEEAARQAEEATRQAEEAARQERERLKREQQEERLAGLRERQRALKTAHVTLTPAERAWQESLRANWAEHGDAEKAPEEPIYRATGDCGRPHLSLSAACACANVRSEPSTSTTRATPASSTSSGPTPGPGRVHASGRAASAPPAQAVSHVTQPDPPVRHAPPAPPPSPRPRGSAPRDQAVPGAPEQVVPRAREQLVPGPGTRVSPPPAPHRQSPPSPPVPPRWQGPPGQPARPVPAPPPRPGVTHSPLSLYILNAARDGNHLSVNGILKTLASRGLGARRQDVYAEVGAMLADGRLVKINDVIKPGRG